ncbi:hypothetical protein AZ78_4512 [Lysobacter capsici AZ78]|uniref:Uncharacterized protein n=1 Tax=Lysobacter capsici AZ78 TaxID=1444315 RepID=A0A120AHZ6_9GAMM|nr:hypothetical protein AZ78_4512 [Lysobacter capsici AZ78]
MAANCNVPALAARAMRSTGRSMRTRRMPRPCLDDRQQENSAASRRWNMGALENWRRSHIATSRIARFPQRNSGFLP